VTLLLAVLGLLAGADDDAAALARVLARLREQVAKCVVAIEVDRESDPEGRGGAGAVAAHRDYLNRPLGPCSGVIYEADGIILTSRFNVSGTIRKGGLKVTLWDGRVLEAERRGTDESRDIALLTVDAKDLPTLPRADLAKLAQGSLVAIVGRAPDKASPTVNLGILSALGRMRDAAVQTDAEMNYGNTGGALVTLQGEFVGIGCNIKPLSHWGQSGGIGFACKTVEIDRLLDRLKKGEHLEAEKLPYLGIMPGEGDPDVEGVPVGRVVPGSPAEKSGLKEGDVITEFNGKKAGDFELLRSMILERRIGDEVVLKVLRKALDKTVELELKARLDGRPEE
jgi:S1-C subfamily serine protease